MSYLLIDGNNLSFRIWSAFVEKGSSGLTNSVGQPTTVIYGMLRALETFSAKHKVHQTIVCWDLGGGSKWRKSLLPQYKGNRVYKDMQPFFDETNACRTYLEAIGITQMPIKGVEADDVIAFLAHRLSKKHQVIVFSDDKDYYQLLQHNVWVWRPCIEKMYTMKEFGEEFNIEGFEPRHLALLDGLTGKDKDNIPGACDFEKGVVKKYGFGPSKAVGLLVAGGYRLANVRHYLQAAKAGEPPSGWPMVNPKFVEQLIRNWKQVKISAKIARLRTKEKHYMPEEWQTLRQHYKEVMCKARQQVRRKNVLNLIDNLELRTVNILPLLLKIGVKLDGNATSTAVRIIV